MLATNIDATCTHVFMYILYICIQNNIYAQVELLFYTLCLAITIKYQSKSAIYENEYK